MRPGQRSVELPGRGLSWLPWAVVVLVSLLVGSARADAYVLRRTSSGLPVRWPSSEVTLEVDPSLTRAVPAAIEAVAEAATGWETDASVRLHVTAATPTSGPAADGHNVIYFLPGYPAASGALAITLVSFDDLTGEIVDADIVINGDYSFAVLPAGARAAAGAVLFANEAGADTKAPSNALSWFGLPAAPPAPFDLVHILSHEAGHAVGLADTLTDSGDVMFLYSAPGDAARRAPTRDDLSGVAMLYGSEAAGGQGCAAAPKARFSSGTPLLVLLGLGLAQRRRRARRSARAA